MQDPSGKGLIGVVAVTGQREDLSLRVVAPITPLPKGADGAAPRPAPHRGDELRNPGARPAGHRQPHDLAVVAHNVGDIGPDERANCIFDCVWLSQAAAEWLKGPKPKK